VFFDEKAKDVPFFAGVNYRINEFQSAILSVQMGRLPGILRDLRARKAAMRQILSKSKNFRVSRNHDVRGDCSTNLPILFPTAEKAIAFKQRFADICPSYRPIDTDRHVYTNWQPILKKQVHHPKLNPWKWAKREISYSTGMCPQTLDILARTICISLPLTKTVTQLKAIAKKLID
jgi:dTDP-4-amino-4,6-dideoxygalactose transaminase